MRCLVVGGGRVGLRKTRRLLDAGARVRLVDPSPIEAFYTLENPELSIEAREYRSSDLDGVRFLFAASSDAALNRKLAEEAKKRGIFCNIADAPEISDFFVPSLVKRGDLSIAVSTEGHTPALAKKIRMALEKQFDAAYIPFVRLMGEIRKEVLLSGHHPEKHGEIFWALADGPLLDLIRENRLTEAAEILDFVVGGREKAEKMIRQCMERAEGDGSPEEQGENP